MSYQAKCLREPKRRVLRKHRGHLHHQKTSRRAWQRSRKPSTLLKTQSNTLSAKTQSKGSAPPVPRRKSSRAPPPVPKKKKYAIAQYDYAAADADELSFSDGDKLVVLQKAGEGDTPDGWCKCGLHGDEGLVPANYIKHC